MRAAAVSTLLMVGLCSSAGSLEAQRAVADNVIFSNVLPDAHIELDSTLTYVGTQTISLGGGTRAEQHFFVEAAGDRIVRLYWVQFEGSSEQGRIYDYSGDPSIEFSGQTFHTNVRFYPPSGFSGRRGSDGDHARRFLESEGYRVGPDLMRVRLVWLLDEPPRNELMIIYLEDLGEYGLTVRALRDDVERWSGITPGLLHRALRGMRIVTPHR